MSLATETRVLCPACGEKLKIGRKGAGRQLNCPVCRAELPVVGMTNQRTPPPIPEPKSLRFGSVAPILTEASSTLAGHSLRKGNRANSVVQRPYVAATVVAIGLVAFVSFGGTWIYFRFSDLFPTGSAAIRSVRQESLVESGVGLVVCGTTEISESGERREVVESTGTAFAISRDGYLLTNHHVVESVYNRMQIDLPLKQDESGREFQQKPEIWVLFGGSQQFSARIVALSSKYDLAILKIVRTDGPYFRLSERDHIARGTKVYALGFPGAAADELSEAEEFESAIKQVRATTLNSALKERDKVYTQTHGEVSRVVSEQAGTSWLQHSAPMSWGNSGGPLITEDGVVVGINTRVSFAKPVIIPDFTKIAVVLLKLNLATQPQLEALNLVNSSVPILGPGTFFSLLPGQARAEIEAHVGSIEWN